MLEMIPGTLEAWGLPEGARQVKTFHCDFNGTSEFPASVMQQDSRKANGKYTGRKMELRQSLCHMIVTFAEMKFGAPRAATSRPPALRAGSVVVFLGLLLPAPRLPLPLSGGAASRARRA